MVCNRILYSVNLACLGMTKIAQFVMPKMIKIMLFLWKGLSQNFMLGDDLLSIPCLYSLHLVIRAKIRMLYYLSSLLWTGWWLLVTWAAWSSWLKPIVKKSWIFEPMNGNVKKQIKLLIVKMTMPQCIKKSKDKYV